MTAAAGQDPGSSVLERFSEELASAVATAAASVVRVHGRRGYALSGVAWREDLVVTTNRAVERERDVGISAGEGADADGELVGHDALTDVALVRAAGLRLPLPAWAPAAGARVGELVLRVGRPGAEPEASFGVVRRAGGEWRSPWGARFPARVASDAPTFRGYSGGPLVTAGGAFLGLGTASLSRAGDVVIPSETVARVASDLLEHGRVRRGYLGLSVQPVRLPADVARAAGQPGGLLVSGLEDDAPAAGVLALGDVVLALGGVPVAEPADLMGALDSVEAGAAVTVRLLRGGAVQTLDVVPGQRA